MHFIFYSFILKITFIFYHYSIFFVFLNSVEIKVSDIIRSELIASVTLFYYTAFKVRFFSFHVDVNCLLRCTETTEASETQ